MVERDAKEVIWLLLGKSKEKKEGEKYIGFSFPPTLESYVPNPANGISPTMIQSREKAKNGSEGKEALPVFTVYCKIAYFKVWL